VVHLLAALLGQRLVVRGDARRDRVVAPRLNLHVVRRVGVDQVDRLPVEQPVHVLGAGAVAAQQAVLAEHPQVAGLGDRVVRRLGHGVGVGQPLLHAGVEQHGQLVGVEAEQRPVDAGLLELGQLDGQQLHVPVGQLRRLVVGDAVCPHLLGCEVAGDVHRHLLQPELLGSLPAGVPADDDAVAVHDDRLAETEAADALGDGLHGVVVEAGVLLVGTDLCDGTHLGLHDTLLGVCVVRVNLATRLPAAGIAALSPRRGPGRPTSRPRPEGVGRGQGAAVSPRGRTSREWPSPDRTGATNSVRIGCCSRRPNRAVFAGKYLIAAATAADCRRLSRQSLLHQSRVPACVRARMRAGKESQCNVNCRDSVRQCAAVGRVMAGPP